MQDLPQRKQQTLSRSVQVTGFGLFHGADVSVELCPAEADFGIVFERCDLADPIRIPALVEFVVATPRCTTLEHQGAQVQVVEHILAALAGLQVDNCLIRIDAPELPIGDGSSLEFVEAILAAGIVAQDRDREVVAVDETLVITESEHVGVGVQPAQHSEYTIGYLLDYGEHAIAPQSFNLSITPETFLSELASARTFALEHEVQALRKYGLAVRASTHNAVVFGADGPLETTLRFANECARHKALDCLGDFALIGCDLVGRFVATRSGHRNNHQMIRQLRARTAPPLACSILPFPETDKAAQCSQRRAAG